MIFKLSNSLLIDTGLPPWRTEGLRIGLWGGSGSGKSNTAALFAEQFLSQGGTVVIFEPRAEYHTLKEKWDIVVCGGPYAKDIDFIPTSPSTYAKAVIEQGVSIIFYTTDVEDETKLIEFISRFLHYLLKYNEVAKRPIMLIVEETQEYAPISTKGRVSPPWVFSRMIKAFKTASIDARKLNIVPIVLSPRPQEVNYTIRQLCNLTFFGKFSPQDIHYIESQCLKYYEHSLYKGKDLLDLETGQFAIITSGQALPLQKITALRQTKHGAETPELAYVAPHKEETEKAVHSLTKTISEALERERLEESQIQKLTKQLHDVQQALSDKTAEAERYRQTAETLGKIRIEQPQPSLDAETRRVVSDLRKHIVAMQHIISIFPYGEQKEVEKPETDKIWETWQSKIPSPCARKVFRFLLDNTGAKFTRTEIAVKCGYSSRSGPFSSALSFLKRQNLIKHEGRFYWIDGERSELRGRRSVAY